MIRKVYVEYEGKCPSCGERQYSSKPEEVDTDCQLCSSKKHMEEIHNTQYKVLEIGVIRGITGYDEKGMPSMMQIFTDEFIYDIEFEKLKISNVWKNNKVIK